MSTDHAIRLQLCHNQLLDNAMVQPNHGPRYAALGILVLRHRALPLPDL